MSFIASNIRFLRKRKGYGQGDLATILELTQTAVSAYEIGKNQPTPEGLEKLADLFGVTIDDLIRKDLSADAAIEEGVTSTPLLTQLADMKREIADLRELVETQRKLIASLEERG